MAPMKAVLWREVPKFTDDTLSTLMLIVKQKRLAKSLNRRAAEANETGLWATLENASADVKALELVRGMGGDGDFILSLCEFLEDKGLLPKPLSKAESQPNFIDRLVEREV